MIKKQELDFEEFGKEIIKLKLRRSKEEEREMLAIKKQS